MAEWGRGRSLLDPEEDVQSAQVSASNDSEGNKSGGVVNELLLSSLLEMGYEERIAKASLVKTSSRSIADAIDWILDNSDTFCDEELKDEEMKDEEDNQEVNAPKEGSDNEEDLMEKNEEVPKERRVISEEERIEQKKRLEARLKDMREQQRLKEIKEEREREIKRVQSASQMTQTKRELEDAKRKNDLEQIKRQKIADKKYRQEILRKVEEAKQERARKFNYSSSSSSSPNSTPQSNHNNNNNSNESNRDSNNNNNRAEYTTCEVAIRYQGNEIKHTFNADDTMQDVYDHVMSQLHGPRVFSLIAGYPKVTFSPRAGNLSISLRDAKLCPRAMIQLHF